MDWFGREMGNNISFGGYCQMIMTTSVQAAMRSDDEGVHGKAMRLARCRMLDERPLVEIAKHVQGVPGGTFCQRQQDCGRSNGELGCGSKLAQQGRGPSRVEPKERAS